MTKYSPEIEERMRLHFAELGEKDRRHYAAIEAHKLGFLEARDTSVRYWISTKNAYIKVSRS